MYIPTASTTLDTDSNILPGLPFHKYHPFTLDTAGVAGAFGGDEAIGAMTMAHVYESRRWLGWYNSPGSIQIARRLWSLANSMTVSSQYISEDTDRIHVDPITLFVSQSGKGPKFRGAYSGTVMDETDRMAALFMKECAYSRSESRVIKGRQTRPVGITIADLKTIPSREMCLPHLLPDSHKVSFLLPIASALACALCILLRDWYALALILWGIIANGASSLVIGSADFVFTHPDPATGCPEGDGILTSDKDIVLLKGKEGAVNSVTRGRFLLRFSSKTHLQSIRICGLLFFTQFFVQLLLIPQATLPGQIIFLFSLGISALYNWWLSSIDTEEIERNLFFDCVLGGPKLYKFTLGTRTTAVVFMLLVFQDPNPTALLKELLPNDTAVWRQWKETILKRLRKPSEQSFQFTDADWDLGDLEHDEQELLKNLYEDAQTAYRGYAEYQKVTARSRHIATRG